MTAQAAIVQTSEAQYGALCFSFGRYSGNRAEQLNHWIELGRAQGLTLSGSYEYTEADKKLEMFDVRIEGAWRTVNALQMALANVLK